jgi:hypothetical protein
MAPKRPLTRDEVFINLGLSGVACSMAQSVVMPFETTMVRQQLATAAERRGLIASLRAIARQEGLRALYRGIEAALIREMSYSTLRFGLYEPLKNLMNENDEANAAFAGEKWAPTVRVAKRMASGCTAGGIASAIASPTDLIKVSNVYRYSLRAAADDPALNVELTAPRNCVRPPHRPAQVRAMKDTVVPIPNLMHYVRTISASPGGPIKPFYEGVSATITRAVVLGATKMTVYNEVKDFLKKSTTCPEASGQPSALQLCLSFTHGWKDVDYQNFGHSSPPSLPERLMLQLNTSVAAGLAVTITTSPFTNARTHMMAHPGVYRSLPHALFSIGATQGPLGYFRGFAAQWARFGPYATVQFLAWEQLRLMCGLPGL